MERKDKLIASYHTLGCKLNFSETSTISRILKERGVEKAGSVAEADIIVVNTCSVTEMADKKGRSLIRRLHRDNPEAAIVVTGCYAQLKPTEVAGLPGVSVVLGSNEKLRISQYVDAWLQTRQHYVATTARGEIKEFMPSCERGDRTRYFLKVQDGCDYFCTYCTIPYARGGSRSGSIDSIVEIARKVADEGGKEIVLTGVNVGEYGRERGENFLDLLKRLDEIEGIARYRISSIEPNLLGEDIIEWVANDSRAFMPHFHIPLQAGSDKVLKMMNRRYDTALFQSRIDAIHSLLPDAFIGVDVIAGARGETEELWQKGKSFIENLDVTRLHVFPYSERPGTAALQIGHIVSYDERHRRTSQLIEISESKHRAFVEKNIGSVRNVLWEAPRRGAAMMHGFTDNYIRISTPYDETLINRETQILLTPDNTDFSPGNE